MKHNIIVKIGSVPLLTVHLPFPLRHKLPLLMCHTCIYRDNKTEGERINIGKVWHVSIMDLLHVSYVDCLDAQNLIHFYL